MFDLVTTQVKPVGRGRGRGTMISSPKVGGTALLGNKSPSPVQAPPGMGLGPRKSVGRGRGAMLQSHAQSTRFAEVEAERKKKEKKLKKMLRQVCGLCAGTNVNISCMNIYIIVTLDTGIGGESRRGTATQ